MLLASVRFSGAFSGVEVTPGKITWAHYLCSDPTDPPRILEPGKWGSKVRGLAHVQGYRGPQGYAFWNLQVPVPNLSTASRLGRFRCQICQHLQGFLNILFFVLLLAAKSLNCGGDRDVGINDGDAMPERSAENQPPQTHSARDHVPPAVTYVPGIAMWRWSEK